MNEEIRDEIQAGEIEVYELEPCEETEYSGGGVLGKLLIGGGLLAIGAAAAFVYKNRDKLKERRIKKLEKEGYVVYKPEIDEEYADIFEEDFEEEESKSEN